MSALAVEKERLRLLREMYARGDIGVERLAVYVEQVLHGEQPHAAGRPIMPDPDLYNYVRIG